MEGKEKNMRSLFGGDTYESDNDERLDRKFSYNYQVIKRIYPKASELPEEEVRGIIRKYYQAPRGQEEQVIKDYISQKEPEWQAQYFDEEKYSLQMNLSGYRWPDIFKKNYPDFDQDFPNVIEGKTSGSLLENDCLPSRRYQKYLRDIKRNEGIGYIDNPRLIDQPTMTGMSRDMYERIRKNNPDIADKYPENVKDLSDDQIDNLYCHFYYKPNHGEFINSDRIRHMVLDLTTMRKSENAVRALQEVLIAYGYPVEIDGILGSKTIKALNSITDPDDFVEFTVPLLQASMPRNSQFQDGWNERIVRY